MQNKHKKIQKCIFENVRFENVYHYKWYSRIYCNMKFILPCPWTKLHNAIHNAHKVNKVHKVLRQVHNLLHNNIYWNNEFSLCFGFVKRAKYKFYILNWVVKLLEESSTNLGKHNYCVLFVALLLQYFFHWTLH